MICVGAHSMTTHLPLLGLSVAAPLARCCCCMLRSACCRLCTSSCVLTTAAWGLRRVHPLGSQLLFQPPARYCNCCCHLCTAAQRTHAAATVAACAARYGRCHASLMRCQVAVWWRCCWYCMSLLVALGCELLAKLPCHRRRRFFRWRTKITVAVVCHVTRLGRRR